MKTLETGTDWLTRLGNATAVDTDRISSHACVVGPWSEPVLTSHNNRERAPLMQSLFWNGRRFWRVIFVDGDARGWFFMWRWTANPVRWQYFQCGIGVKLNGRIGILCRLQNDQSSAAGVSGPNLGQASGWTWGPK